MTDYPKIPGSRAHYRVLIIHSLSPPCVYDCKYLFLYLCFDFYDLDVLEKGVKSNAVFNNENGIY